MSWCAGERTSSGGLRFLARAEAEWSNGLTGTVEPGVASGASIVGGMRTELSREQDEVGEDTRDIAMGSTDAALSAISKAHEQSLTDSFDQADMDFTGNHVRHPLRVHGARSAGSR